MPSLASLAGKFRTAVRGKQQAAPQPSGRPDSDGLPPSGGAEDLSNSPAAGGAAVRSIDTPPAYKPPLSPPQIDQKPWGAAGDASGDGLREKKKKSLASKIKSTFSGLTGLRSKTKETHIHGVTAYSNRSGRGAPVSREAARHAPPVPPDHGRSGQNGAAPAGSSSALEPKRVRIDVAERVRAMGRRAFVAPQIAVRQRGDVRSGSRASCLQVSAGWV